MRHLTARGRLSRRPAARVPLLAVLLLAAPASTPADDEDRAFRRAVNVLEAPAARHGRLPVRAVFADPAPDGAADPARWRIRALVRLAPLAGAAEPSFRVWVALAGEDEEPELRSWDSGVQPLAAADAWLFETDLLLPEGFRDGAVVVEVADSGLWGAALIEPPETPLELDDLEVVAWAPAAAGPALPAAAEVATAARAGTQVRLLPPRQRPATGRTRFSTLVSDPEIARVTFSLDGAEVATDERAPFSAVLDLGPEAALHRVRAEAFSSTGRPLGADEIEVNRAAGLFEVRITRLQPVGAGELEVAAEVAVPGGRALERVELYLNDRKVAEGRATPFVARFAAPGSGPSDFVRAVATLDDGAAREDARLVSSRSDRVAVNLVEIYAIVTDRKGEPRSDLAASDFTVRLGGRRQAIERFSPAADVPLALGLIVDTSESMWALMPDTKQAGAKFLADTLRPQDRAFLIDFDTRPRLAHAATADLGRLLRAFRGLEPGGFTAMWDAVLFGLLQFDDPGGRRALILLTDGDDYQSRFSRRLASGHARQLGVPVYLVSLAGILDPFRALPKLELDALALATGGRSFYISKIEELDRVYGQINAELKSQYLLAFSTERALDDDELDSIRVDVRLPRHQVRAVVGGRLLG